MSWLEFLLIGIGLSMDAFAASVCKGLGMQRVRRRDVLLIGGLFGGFQALMPLLGWLLGRQFEQYITRFDHWIAFGLLAFIGGKMIWDALHGEDEEEAGEASLKLKELLTLAVATSIDALAVGISFAFLEVDIFKGISIIGLTTFALSVAGVYIGHTFGKKYQKRAVLAGGIILVLIGLKILLEHLGVF